MTERDRKLKDIIYWHTCRILNIEEEGGKTDNEDKEKCDIYNDTISAIKSLFPQELERTEVKEDNMILIRCNNKECRYNKDNKCKCLSPEIIISTKGICLTQAIK